jgi:hypothetical protein
MRVKQIISIFCIFFVLHIPGFGQEGNQEPLSLGSGFIGIDDQKSEIIIEKGILFSSTSMVYDTVVWIEKGNTSHPLFYPQLVKGSHAIIRLTARDVKNQNVFYDIFVELMDTLTNRYPLNTGTAKVFVIKNGELHDRPFQMKSLDGEFIIFTRKKKELEVSLYFKTMQFNWGKENLIDCKASFTLPAFEYRESDIVSPVAKKAKQKIYKRNMQLAGLMVMIFLAIFFFD